MLGGGATTPQHRQALFVGTGEVVGTYIGLADVGTTTMTELGMTASIAGNALATRHVLNRCRGESRDRCAGMWNPWSQW
jgi:hypothetical protein